VAADPLWIIKLQQGGMSFHGGMLGVLAAFWYFKRKTGKSYFTVADFIVPMVPVGLATGRFGNFINGELWGRPTDVSWGMVFPG
jgi:phosphatidylglycerol---prolipoprotein diacylglyceryl transferase